MNLELPLEGCWGRAGTLLGEELAEAVSVPAALRLLVRALRSRLASPPRSDAFAARVRELLQPWHARTVAAVSGELFLSERQLRRRTLALFGFGPKELQRILRFQAFLAVLQDRWIDELELSRLAALLGYADQSHLSRECRQLTGIAPRQLQQELSERCGRHHDHSVSFDVLRVRFLQDTRLASP